MSKGCVLYPRVTSNKTGAVKNSPFYNSLLEHSGTREVSNTLFNKFTAMAKERVFGKKNLNEFGEVSLLQFIERTDALNYFDKNTFIKAAFNKLGIKTDPEGLTTTTSSVKDLLMDLYSFNRSEYGKVLNLSMISDKDGNIEFTLNKLNRQEIANRKQAEGVQNLLNRLQELTEKHGFSTEYIDSIEGEALASGKVSIEPVEGKVNEFKGLITISQKGDVSTFIEEHTHALLALMADHKLVSRLRDYLYSDDNYKRILGEQYSEYHDLYNGDVGLMVEEAMGKLVTKAILDKAEVPVANTLVGVAMEELSKIDLNELNEILETSRDIAELITNTKYEKHLNEALKASNLSLQRQLYQLRSDPSSNLEEKLDDLIGIVNKKAQMEEAGRLYKDYEDKDIVSNKLALRTLLTAKENFEALSSGDKMAAFDAFIGQSTKELSELLKISEAVMHTDHPIEERAAILYKLKNLIDATNESVSLFNLMIQGGDFNKHHSVKIRVGALVEILNKAEYHFKGLVTKINIEALSPFAEDASRLIVKKGEYYSLEELLKMAPYDVGEVAGYLKSMAQMGDPVLGLIDRMTRKYQSEVYQHTLEFRKKVFQLAEKYKKRGITDYSFMRMKDENGNRLFNYIGEWDNARLEVEYKAAYKAYLDSIEGETNIQKRRAARDAFRQAMKEKFFTEIKEGDTTRLKPKTEYTSPQWLRLTATQREFMREFFALKETIDRKLPPGVVKNAENGIAVRKDKMERFLKNGIKDAAKSLTDVFQFTSDDTEIANALNKEVGFDGRKILGVPIYFHRLQMNEDMADISEDEISNLIAYGAMGFNYAIMRDASYLVELQMYSVKNRAVRDTSLGRAIRENRVTSVGNGVEIIHTSDALSDKNNAAKVLQSFIEKMYYGISTTNTVVNVAGHDVNVNKAVKSLGALDGFARMSLNLLNAASNVINGEIPIIIEALSSSITKAGKFGVRQYLKASKEYGFRVPELIAELNNPNKTSKLGLISELFDISQKEQGAFRGTDYNKKFYQKFNTRTLSFLQEAGEHALAHKTAIAMLMNTKLKDKYGKEISLYDALEVEYLSQDRKEGARLKIKDGVTKLDGTEFDMSPTSNDLLDVSSRIGEFNRTLQGIYNLQDSNMLNKNALGALMLGYRKWIVPFYNKRFGKRYYNFNLKEETEGHYRTAGNFVFNVMKDLIHLRFSFMEVYNDLEGFEKQNVVKAFLEMALLGFLTLFTGFMWPDDDDDKNYKDRTWLSLVSEYLLRRVTLDMQLYIPNTNMFEAFRKTVSSPAVAMGTASALINILNMLIDVTSLDAFDTIERGRYKGQWEMMRYIYNLPGFNIIKSIDNFIHPEYLLPYLLNDKA